jgi:hypothetical protein
VAGLICRRTLLIGGAGAAAAGIALVASNRLITPRAPTVGFLSNVSLADPRIVLIVQGFRDGLRQEGLIEGDNLDIEWHTSPRPATSLPPTASPCRAAGHRMGWLAPS